MAAPSVSPVGTGLEIVELTERTWPLLERLFGPRGAVAGCWCTWFRQSARDFARNSGTANRELLRGLVRQGAPVGLLALEEGEPVGWVAVAPRAGQVRLERSRIAAPADPAQDPARVWAVTCFFIHHRARRRGVARTLLDAAVAHATRHGAQSVEGYPVDTAGQCRDSGELYHGTLNLFLGAGFELVERRGARRAVVRRSVAADRS
ncbi:MAG TPA: GNAT family N-acetyltransferase [Pseudonocardiaceae bacterium]